MESATDAVEVERVQTGYDPEVKREKIQREREKFDRMSGLSGLQSLSPIKTDSRCVVI